MKRTTALAAIALACAPLASRAETAPGAATRSVDEIAACMRANVVDRGALRDVRVQATDASGSSRTLRMKLFWKPRPDAAEDRMMLRVLEPRDVARTAYLAVSRPDAEDVYMYVPAVDRVQRLVGANEQRTLLGTDFTLAEIRQLQGLLQRGETRRVADAQVEGRPVYVLQTATSLEETGYRRIDSYVDQASCALFKAELFGKGETARKVLEADVSTLIDVEIVEGGPFWLVLGYRMRDLSAGTATRIDLSDVYLLERLPEDLFAPASFHRVPLPEP
jgi:hypothetical protein